MLGNGYEGVEGISNVTNGYGIVGIASGNATYSGYFTGGEGLYANGNWVVQNGTNSALVPVGNEWRKLYCEDAAEVYFNDYGSGTLVNGRAHVTLDSIFLQTVTIDTANPMRVFIEMNSESNGVYVTKNLTGFDRSSKTAAGLRADHSITALLQKRKGYESNCMESAIPPDRSKHFKINYPLSTINYPLRIMYTFWVVLHIISAGVIIGLITNAILGTAMRKKMKGTVAELGSIRGAAIMAPIMAGEYRQHWPLLVSSGVIATVMQYNSSFFGFNTLPWLAMMQADYVVIMAISGAIMMPSGKRILAMATAELSGPNAAQGASDELRAMVAKQYVWTMIIAVLVLLAIVLGESKSLMWVGAQ